MAVIRFINHTRLAKAIIVAALSIAVAGSAYAARGSDTPRGDRGGKDTGRPSVRNRDTGGSRQSRSSGRQDKQRGPVVNQPARPGSVYPGRSGQNDNQRPKQSTLSQLGKIILGKPQGQTLDHRRDNTRYQPYRPPTHFGGKYYYPARPSTKPLRYGYWVFDRQPSYARRSAYFYFGLFPYILFERAHVRPYVVIGYRSGPVVIRGTYYLDRGERTGLDSALADIRNAWLGGRADLIKDHVDTSRQIAVLLDGKYDYSVDGDDYIEMTNDAIDQMQTVGFTWLETRERTDGSYTAFGKHTYRDSAKAEKTVYVSYTLEKVGGKYIIEEVGSSALPLN